MNTRVKTTMITLSFLFGTPLASFGQENIIETSTEFSMEYLNVIVRQTKNSEEGTCKAKIFANMGVWMMEDITLKLEAVGGSYGVSTPSEVLGHVVITSQGSYNGSTIVIDDTGHIFKTIGGEVYYDEEANLILNIYLSDFSGISVFNLEDHSILMETIDFGARPISIHKAFGDRYFIKAEYDENTGDYPIWEIELEFGMMTLTDLSSQEINDSNMLSHVPLEDLNCECK
ncbi:MAG: hypothetical protein HWD92_07395 [Flavobacteriia bacterium]|nr:hypothetical protein [Flavobacteriia bacterium]